MENLAMISTHSLPTEQHGRQENLCWYALRGDPCPYGTKCKFPHIASVHIDGIIQTMVNEGTVLTVKESSRIKKGLIWKLSLTFRKTRLCFKFARNICLYDEDCIFVHAKGPDARTILALANQQKACPWQMYLNLCPEIGCPFKHEITSGDESSMTSAMALPNETIISKPEAASWSRDLRSSRGRAFCRGRTFGQSRPRGVTRETLDSYPVGDYS